MRPGHTTVRVTPASRRAGMPPRAGAQGLCRVEGTSATGAMRDPLRKETPRGSPRGARAERAGGTRTPRAKPRVRETSVTRLTGRHAPLREPRRSDALVSRCKSAVDCVSSCGSPGTCGRSSYTIRCDSQIALALSAFVRPSIDRSTSDSTEEL
jgi:hypothetical protein